MRKHGGGVGADGEWALQLDNLCHNTGCIASSDKSMTSLCLSFLVFNRFSRGTSTPLHISSLVPEESLRFCFIYLFSHCISDSVSVDGQGINDLRIKMCYEAWLQNEKK